MFVLEQNDAIKLLRISALRYFYEGNHVSRRNVREVLPHVIKLDSLSFSSSIIQVESSSASFIQTFNYSRIPYPRVSPLYQLASSITFGNH